MQCPTPEELSLCLLGKLSDARVDVLLQHAEQCEKCGKVVDSLDGSSEGLTDALKHQSSFEVTGECERMIDRVEGYVQGDYASAPPDTKKHLLQGTRVRDYEIIRPIGEGGMGTVFLARHNRLNREVALKVLSLRRSNDREAQQRFEQEMEIVGKLQHPGIVRALDAGEHEGVQYLVMELVTGVDLRQLVDAVGPIPVMDACEICRQAAAALQYAHHQQLIHRDVKPSNIMLTGQGGVKVMDLGLARFTDQHRSLTSTHQAIGSLDFMAPEQLRAQTVDHRADVYALGCTLHFLLLGEPPEKRRTASLMVARTPKLESLRSVLPPPLTRLLQRMLASDPARRIDSLRDVAEQLAPFCNRADLSQLVNRAAGNLSCKLPAATNEITSKIELPVAIATTRHMWFWSAIAGLMLVGAAISWPWLAGSQSGANLLPLEVSGLPCVSSNIQPTREIPLFQIHDGAVRCVAFAESTSQLICGSDDGSLTIRDLPNQSRTIRICGFDSPLVRLCVEESLQLVACVDATGAIAMISLPKGETVWSLPGTVSDSSWGSSVEAGDASKFESIPAALQFTDTMLLVRTAAGDDLAFQLDDGGRAEVSGDDSNKLTRLPSRTARSVGVVLDRMVVAGQRVSTDNALVLDDVVCLIDGNLLRLLDLADLRGEHYVYAEHTSPISAVMPLADNSLFLTADDVGEIRLWHAPNRVRSDMLLSCATKLDSAELTFQIHRQQQWTRRDFATVPGNVKLDDPTHEMRIETQIDRNGRQYVLEYRIKSN